MLWGCSRFHLGKRGLFVGVLCAISIFFSRRWRIFYESRLLYHVLSPCPFILPPPPSPFLVRALGARIHLFFSRTLRRGESK